MSIERPFSQWRVRPQVGEPSYSYFARLVADEGHSSLKIYATEIGLNGRDIVPEEMLKAVFRLPLTEVERERLRNATPIRRDGYWYVGAERVRTRQFSFATRRFCPYCLANNPYHHVYWDVLALTHCAEHLVPLSTKMEIVSQGVV